MAGRVVLTDKDEVLNKLDDDHGLEMTDEEYERLRRIPLADLFMLQGLFIRAVKHERGVLSNVT